MRVSKSDKVHYDKLFAVLVRTERLVSRLTMAGAIFFGKHRPADYLTDVERPMLILGGVDHKI